MIGAIALVLLVVIILPAVFDSEPQPATGNNIELRIPNKDSAGEFQPKIDLPELDKMASEVAAASTVAGTAAAASAPAAISAPAPEKKPPVQASAPGKAKPETRPRPEAKPKTESKPAAKAPAVPKSGWALQLGAFANADTAKSMQARLSKQGYHAYTEKAGSVVRVRVGSYPTREAAEKIQRKLEAQGSQANVVNLE
ncbi:MAG TPA: SPOR domain-containing protein [Sideroxyarcus sp.]|nr:SPOR domain-containing protein [Sideroxyarcus sp.]